MPRILGFDSQTVIQLIIQLFNTSLLSFLLYIILYKPVTKFLNNRTTRIENSIKKAQNSLTEAQKMKEFYEEKLEIITEERDKIIEDARIRANEIEAKIIEDAKKEAESIKEKAMNSIKMERENAVNDMKAQIIDISTLMAEKYISKNIDKDTQKKLLDEVISDVGDATWVN